MKIFLAKVGGMIALLLISLTAIAHPNNETKDLKAKINRLIPVEISVRMQKALDSLKEVPVDIEPIFSIEQTGKL